MKVTKKNSIYFNQLWILKVIEDGNMKLLPHNSLGENLSIGEYLEALYEGGDFEPKYPPVTKENSTLYELEWIGKALQDGKELPLVPVPGFSLGRRIELMYFEEEIMNADRNPNKVFMLKGEK